MVGYLYHIRWPANSKTTARCEQCHKLLTPPLQRTFMYHRDRFHVRITPDEENQLVDVIDSHQMDALTEHYSVIETEKINAYEP